MNLYGTTPINETLDAEKEVFSENLLLQQSKAIEGEVIRTIEVLCQYISKVGPEFENVVRVKEAKNPKFAFLNGGEPGTPAAIACEYFQWMKRKYCLKMGSCNEPAQEFTSLKPSQVECPPENVDYNAATNSLASSDMDIEDDKESYMEDVSSIMPLSGAVECCEDNTIRGAGVSYDDPGLVHISSAANGSKNIETSRVFVKDGNSFRLIQGYASDESGEDIIDDSSYAIDSIKAPASLVVDLPSNHNNDTLKSSSKLSPKNYLTNDFEQEHPIHFKQPIMKEPSLLQTSASLSPSTNKDKFEDKAGKLEPQNNDTTDVLKIQGKESNSSKPNLDEFGRLIKVGISDSDSDDSQYNGSHGKRRGWSRNEAHEEHGRHSQRSYKRRRDERSRSKSLSPRRSRSRSPRALRKNNLSGRRDGDRLQECFNFVRGRCFRGESCHFLHCDFGQSTDKRQGSRNGSSHNDMHDPVSYSEKSHRATEMTEVNDLPEEKKLHLKGLSEAGNETANEVTKSSYHSKMDDVLSGVEQSEKQVSVGESAIDLDNTMKQADRVIKLREALGSSKGFQEEHLYHPYSHIGKEVDFVASDNLVHATQLNSEQSPPSLTYPSSTSKASSQLQPSGTQMYPTFTIPNNDVSASLASQNPMQNPLPLISTYQCGFSQKNVPYYQQHPIASRNQSQNAHPLSTAYSNSMPSHFNQLPSRPLFPGVGFHHLHSQQNIFASRNNFAQPPLRPYAPMEHVRPRGDNFHQFTLHMDHLPIGTYIQSSGHKDIGVPLPSLEVSTFAQQDVTRLHSSSNQLFISQSPPERNMPPHSDIGVSKSLISMTYNPYASAFEEGTSNSNFKSSLSTQGNNDDCIIMYNSSFKSSHGAVGVARSSGMPSKSYVEGTGEQVLPKTSSYAHETSGLSPKVQQQTLSKSEAGAPYDPLFDSIEPSPDALKKLGNSYWQSLPFNNAETKSRFSNLTSPISDGHSKLQKGDLTAKFNSEFEDLDEVAVDAEDDVVDNENPQLVDEEESSLDIQVDLRNTDAGENEIDQAHSISSGEKKYSRSMKLFKIAIVKFVKKVLKTPWQQGDMSKEAFKIIVRKTVDKVVGAMSSHHLPKSQAKIDQYVESSERKLTKLVMGYVDKYAKM